MYKPFRRMQNDLFWSHLRHFDENDMNYIKKTNLELALRERKTALRDDFDRLLKNLPEGMSKEDIKW